MKFAFLFSGAFGFLLVTAVGLASGRLLDLVLRDAAVACLLAAIVGRWFWTGLEKAFAQTLATRRAEAEAAEEAAEAAVAAAAAASRRPQAASPSATPASKTPASAAPAAKAPPAAPKPAAPPPAATPATAHRR